MINSPRRRRPTLALRSIVCGLAAAAVLAASAAAPPDPQPVGWWADDTDVILLPPDRRPVPPPAAGAKRYVALGDSFSSGEGAPLDVVVDGDGPLGLGDEQYKAFYGDPLDDGYACHRSPQAYPVGVVSRLGPGWGLDFRACSGAVFDDLDRVQNGEPAQTGAFAGDGADLITMTMGGNDLKFGPIVAACVGEALTWSAVGADCRTREAAFAGLADLRVLLAGRYADLQENLRPGGRLVVLGYPRFFPQHPADSCGVGGGLFGIDGAGFPGNIGAANMLWLNSVAERLSSAIAAAASDVGATYVDVTDLLNTTPGTADRDRHDACVDDEDRRWVNRTIGTNKFEPLLGHKWSWHPRAGAHARMAELVHGCVRDPMSCDSPERREADRPAPAPAPAPCLSGCPDLTVSDRWSDLATGPLRSDGPGMTDTMFRALYLPECERTRDGPGRGTEIARVARGDLTGDGWNEAVVVTECAATTSGWPEHVTVLDGAGGPRVAEVLGPEITNGRLVADGDRPATILENLEPGVADGVLTVAGSARSTRVITAAAADFTYRQAFRRLDGEWSVGPVESTPAGGTTAAAGERPAAEGLGDGD